MIEYHYAMSEQFIAVIENQCISLVFQSISDWKWNRDGKRCLAETAGASFDIAIRTEIQNGIIYGKRCADCTPQEGSV